MAKSNLMSLPMELREEIYTLVLLSPWALTSSCNNKASHESWLPRQTPEKTTTYNVYFPDLPNPGDQLYAASPLLGASRRLRNETIALIRRLQDQRQIPWQLELNTIDEQNLEVRWTHLPIPPTLYSPYHASFAGNTPELSPDHSGTPSGSDDEPNDSSPSPRSGHDIVVTCHVPPADDLLPCYLARHTSRQIWSNILSVMGYWCQNGMAFTRKNGNTPFIDTLMIFYEPQYPRQMTTQGYIETALDDSNPSKGKYRQTPEIAEWEQRCRLGCLQDSMRILADSGLLSGHFRQLQLVYRPHLPQSTIPNIREAYALYDEAAEERPPFFTCDSSNEFTEWKRETEEQISFLKAAAVLNQPTLTMIKNAAAWAHFGWVTSFPRWQGKASLTYLRQCYPSGKPHLAIRLTPPENVPLPDEC